MKTINIPEPSEFEAARERWYSQITELRNVIKNIDTAVTEICSIRFEHQQLTLDIKGKKWTFKRMSKGKYRLWNTDRNIPWHDCKVVEYLLIASELSELATALTDANVIQEIFLSVR